MPVRVALVDDDQFIHDIIADLLRVTDDVTLVGQALRGEDALALVGRVNPDVLLMDVRMPGIDGAQAARQVLAAHPEVRILALSSYQDYEDIKAILDAGALGYIVKGSEADDLLDTIRLTQQGKSVLTREIVETLISPPADPAGSLHLTDREQEVLKLMAGGMNNREVAQALDVSVATVRFHIVNVQEKLGVGSRSAALVAAARNQLI